MAGVFTPCSLRGNFCGTYRLAVKGAGDLTGLNPKQKYFTAGNDIKMIFNKGQRTRALMDHLPFGRFGRVTGHVDSIGFHASRWLGNFGSFYFVCGPSVIENVRSIT
jgi:hypothetical protein